MGQGAGPRRESGDLRCPRRRVVARTGGDAPGVSASGGWVGGARVGGTALSVLGALAALAWGAPATLAQVSFTGPTNFAVRSDPSSVAVGDFDGDGHLDLAVANGNSNNVSVLLNAADADPPIARGDSFAPPKPRDSPCLPLECSATTPTPTETR